MENLIALLEEALTVRITEEFVKQLPTDLETKEPLERLLKLKEKVLFEGNYIPGFILIIDVQLLRTLFKDKLIDREMKMIAHSEYAEKVNELCRKYTVNQLTELLKEKNIPVHRLGNRKEFLAYQLAANVSRVRGAGKSKDKNAVKEAESRKEADYYYLLDTIGTEKLKKILKTKRLGNQMLYNGVSVRIQVKKIRNYLEILNKKIDYLVKLKKRNQNFSKEVEEAKKLFPKIEAAILKRAETLHEEEKEKRIKYLEILKKEFHQFTEKSNKYAFIFIFFSF